MNDTAADDAGNNEEKKEPVQAPVQTYTSKPSNTWKSIGIVMTVLFLVMVAVYVMAPPTGAVVGAPISAQEAGDLAVNYIKENLVSPTVEVNAANITKIGNFYQISIRLSSQGTSQNVASFMSLDGRYFFPSGYDMTETSTVATTTIEEIPKTDKPSVELYVMSFCPYGNRAENTMQPVYDLLKNKINFTVNYIVSVDGTAVNSLHGQPEVDENEREACVLKEYGLDKWWNFTVYVNNNCGSNGACWEDAAKNTSIDVNKIKTCVTNNGLALMKANADASELAGASGSPTMFINGVQSSAVYSYENPEAYKQAICSAFTTEPSECSTVLAGTDTSSSSGGSC